MNAANSASSQQMVLVTGATVGIGYELSKLFAHQGHPLVLVSRNIDRLAKVADKCRSASGTTAKIISKDLARPESPAELFAELERDSISISILVNNAGFGTYGPFAAADVKSQLDMLQVNVASLTHLTRLLLPDMIARSFGKILNVASTAAFQPGPLMAVYYASKAYVLSFSEALGNELNGTGVSVSALCPGPTTTEFQQRARMQKSKLVSGALMDAHAVALAGYRGLMKDKPVIIPGVGNRLLAFSTRLTPRKLVTAIVRRMMEERRER
jgi:short-subunit dehydrogenase